MFRCHGLIRRPFIEGFDLDLAAGEIVVLRGPSGSGKTLLLRGLADLDPIDAGDLALADRDRCSMPAREWRSRVTYLHQTPVRSPAGWRLTPYRWPPPIALSSRLSQPSGWPKNNNSESPDLARSAIPG